MTDEIITSKWRRKITTTKVAAKVGAQALGYYSKRPFLSESKKQEAKITTATNSAKTLFRGLSLLRGTALKMAQQLSLESDLLPAEACTELAKAYHQVPPLNRALARRVIKDAFGGWPEEIFPRFETKAFAAASLGQVHLAKAHDGQTLAIKLQYPGIAQTIDDDLKLLRNLLRPLLNQNQIEPALEEVAERLREEVNYIQEAESLQFFKENLSLQDINIPQLYNEATFETVLTTSLLPGTPLNTWAEGSPPQEERDRIAFLLNEVFVTSLYSLNCIHADPNPGNFLIDGTTLGIVDFGCVKHLDPTFVEQYRQLTLAAAHQDHAKHYQIMIDTGIIPQNLEKGIETQVRSFCNEMCKWYGRLYADEVLDFSQHPDLMMQGKKLMSQYRHLSPYFQVNTDYIFLDRTRYGLLRIFEMIGARVSFRNRYEF